MCVCVCVVEDTSLSARARGEEVMSKIKIKDQADGGGRLVLGRV
jgi:hypothetical protein